MKCHHITFEGERYLIAGCMQVAHSNDIDDCLCHTNDTFQRFEKDRYNRVLSEKDALIKKLREENDFLLKKIGNGY